MPEEHVNANASNIPAGAEQSVAEVRDQELAAAAFITDQLRLEANPEDAMINFAQNSTDYAATLGYAPPGATAWAWMLEPAFNLPSGWSTQGSDPEGAAFARERFAQSPKPAVISVPDADTFLAVPIGRRSADGERHSVGFFAVPLLPDVEPDEALFTLVETTAAIAEVQMENALRSRTATRALQFAQAASQTQRQLADPTDRATALQVAVDALFACDDVIGCVGYEIIDGEDRVAASSGDLDAPLESVEWGIDEGLQSEVREASRVELPVAIDEIAEARIVLQCRRPVGEVELDTLASIASAIAGTTARFRADATIESLRRSATRRLVEAQERERSMVAADIHDGVLQQLGATAIRLELAQSRVEQRDFDTAATIISDGANEIRSCARELRSLLMELRPQVLDDNGLNAALSELGRHVEGVEVEVTSDVPDDLSSEFSITIFRIVQEALTNIQKHARATRASVDVTLGGRTIEIDIRDNGVGYEGAVTGPSAEGSHLGLLGMRERARMFGGSFSIAGVSGGGTEIRATLPTAGTVDPGY